MKDSAGHTKPSSFWLLLLPALFVISITFAVQEFEAANNEAAASATYMHGVLDLTMPYHATHAGPGQLTVEFLDTEDQVLGTLTQYV
jgi:hypothetical protein